MRSSGRVAITIFVIVLVCLYVVIFAVPKLAGTFKQTDVLEYGHLSVEDEVTGYLVRDETVYVANRAGTPRYYVGEGVKIRKGVKLLDIVAGGAFAPDDADDADDGEAALTALAARIGDDGVAPDAYTAPASGIVSYFIDGYERVFAPDNLSNLVAGDARDLSGVVNVTRSEGEAVRRGDPLYKIADNTRWYMVFWLDRDSGSVVHYEKGGTVKVAFSSEEVNGLTVSVTDEPDAWRVTLAFDKYYEAFARVRETPARVIVADYTGLIVGNESITTRDGRTGVYARRKNGSFEFVPVNVTHSDGKRSVVSVSSFVSGDGKEVRTVNVYEEILRDPSREDGETDVK